jgi:hypothetical protein
MNSVCIYIHRGLSDYQDNIFALTRHFNKNNRIILIGDADNYNVAIKHGIEHYMISNYDEEIPYHHVSVNSESYEKFCFSRWFILKNFMNKHGIDHAIYSDSDNCIIYDFNSIKYDDACLIGKSNIVFVPNLFFTTKNSLIQICEYYLQLYSLNYNDFKKKVEETIYIQYINNNSHYSDMMFLRMSIEKLGIHFDKLVTENFGYVYNRNINNIQTNIIGDKVYSEKKQLLNLHFAGSAKNLVSNYMSLITSQSNP